MILLSQVQAVCPGVQLAKGDKDRIENLSSLLTAGPGDATFLVNSRNERQVKQSRADVLIVNVDHFPFVLKDFSGSIWNCPDPLVVLKQIGDVFERQRFGDDEFWSSAGIHDTAIVEEGAEIDESARVGPYCVVRKGAVVEANVSLLAYVYVGCGARLGQGCVVGAHVAILGRTVVGAGTRVHCGAVLGSKGFGVLRNPEGQNVPLPQLGQTVIGKHSRIGCHATVDRATFGETKMGDRAFMDNHTHVGHNAQTGCDFIICAMSGLCGSSKAGDRVAVGALSGLGDHVTVVDDVSVGAVTGVHKNVSERGIVMKGNYGRPIKDFMIEQSCLRRLPKLFEEIRDLKRKIADLEKENNER